MEQKKTFTPLNLLVILSYLLMVAVNALANLLPINNISTGDVSALYDNMFAPAGLTFSIWGLIYLMLGAYCIYQIHGLSGSADEKKSRRFALIGALFVFSSLVNSAWIFAWHYQQLVVTLILMVALLVSLAVIAKLFLSVKLNRRDKLLIRLPFSIYFGWITIATIANVTAWLVDIGWDGLGRSEPFWTVIIVVVGLAIVSATILLNQDFFYGLVGLWAYGGILLRHLSEDGFDSAYTSVITAVGISMIFLVLVLAIEAVFARRKRLATAAGDAIDAAVPTKDTA